MKSIAQIILILLVIVTTSIATKAQPGLPMAPDQAPIDGGLTLLAAAGGAYAVKKLRDRKAGENTEE